MHIVKVKFPITSFTTNKNINTSLEKSKRPTLYSEEDVLKQKSKTSKHRNYVLDMFNRQRVAQEQIDHQLISQRNLNLKNKNRLTPRIQDNDHQPERTNIFSPDNDIDKAPQIDTKPRIYHVLQPSCASKRPVIEGNIKSSYQEGKAFVRLQSFKSIIKSKSHIKLKEQLNPESQVREFNFPNQSKINSRSRLQLSPKILSQFSSSINIPAFILDEESPIKKKHNTLKSMLIVKRSSIFDEILQEKLNSIIASNLDHASMKQGLDPTTFSFQINMHNRMPRKQETYVQNDTFLQLKKHTKVRTKHRLVTEKDKSQIMKKFDNQDELGYKYVRYRDDTDQGITDHYTSLNTHNINETDLKSSQVKSQYEQSKPFYGDLISNTNDLIIRDNVKKPTRIYQSHEELGFQDTNDKNELEDYFHHYVKKLVQ